MLGQAVAWTWTQGLVCAGAAVAKDVDVRIGCAGASCSVNVMCPTSCSVDVVEHVLDQ